MTATASSNLDQPATARASQKRFSRPLTEIEMMTLMQIVQDENLVALEHFCLGRTYQQVRQRAIDEGVDLDALEELLARI